MKTLIFNGSPHPEGDTAQLLRHCTDALKGEYRIVHAYTADISPCIDCRACQKQLGCVIEDEMQQVYAYLQDCDNILIASPVYFSQPTGRLLDVCSRLQMLFCARFFLKTRLLQTPKKGGVILVGGGNGAIDRAYDTAKILLHEMGCDRIHPPVSSHNTDRVPAAEDMAACQRARNLAMFFNGAKAGQAAFDP